MRILKLMAAICFLITADSSCVAPQEGPPIYDEDVKLVGAAAMDSAGIHWDSEYCGTVVVRVTLDKHGMVKAASAISGIPALVSKCLSNARQWQFEPNRQRSAIIVYEFRLGQRVCEGTAFRKIRGPNLVEVTVCPPLANP